MPILAKIWMVLLSKFHCLSILFFFLGGRTMVVKITIQIYQSHMLKTIQIVQGLFTFKDRWQDHSRDHQDCTILWSHMILLSNNFLKPNRNSNEKQRLNKVYEKKESFYKIYPKNTHTFARQRDENQKVKEVAQIFILHSH